MTAPETSVTPSPGDGAALSVRAMLTGAALGALLSACNIYSGLRIGWSSNMSIVGALLAFALWQTRTSAARAASPFTIHEANLSQSACSAGAAVSSAGLVASVPALTMLTGQVLSWAQLAAWVASACFVGIVVAVPLRRQMIVVDALPFPMGAAVTEMLEQMYARGSEALTSVRAMLGAAGFATVWKLLEHAKVLTSVAAPGTLAGYPLKSLTFALDPSVLLVAVGGLMGLRSCLSLALGALVSWAVLAPLALSQGFVAPGADGKPWFKEVVAWLLWPGVTIMVVSSLVSLSFSWRSMARSLRGLGGGGAPDPSDVPQRWMLFCVVAASVGSIAAQATLFGTPLWLGALSVALAIVLGVVGARVQGETGVTPIGAMGKVTQLVAGVAAPGDVTANLMTANVTGGAASQCADLMNDLKTGHMLGTAPRSQFVSQLTGALAGALAGSAIYLALIPDPKRQLFTPEWPAPAVATWKAVAEVMSQGVGALPGGATVAIAVGAVVATLLAVVEVKATGARKRWFPSPAALGLGFVVPFNQSLSMVLGGVLAVGVARWAPGWHGRLWMIVCSGIIAGESLTGVGIVFWEMAQGAFADAK